jgi:hypothetical protein
MNDSGYGFLEEKYLRTQYSDLLNQAVRQTLSVCLTAIACVARKGLRLYGQRRLLICNRIDYIIVS